MVTTNTKVGHFSHAVLAFEYANLITSFKSGGVFPLRTFQALFLPDEQLVSLGLLECALSSTSQTVSQI